MNYKSSCATSPPTGETQLPSCSQEIHAHTNTLMQTGQSSDASLKKGGIVVVGCWCVGREQRDTTGLKNKNVHNKYQQKFWGGTADFLPKCVYTILK